MVEAAARILAEMATFAEAGVPENSSENEEIILGSEAALQFLTTVPLG